METIKVLIAVEIEILDRTELKEKIESICNSISNEDGVKEVIWTPEVDEFNLLTFKRN